MDKIDEKFEIKQSVGFVRRILVHVFENAFYLALFGLGPILMKINSSQNLGEIFERIDYYSITVALIILFDQICGPAFFGATMGRRVFGYRIQKRQRGNPTIIMSLVRVSSLWLLETLSVGIVTWITSIKVISYQYF